MQDAMTGQQGLERVKYSTWGWRKVSYFFCYPAPDGFFCRKEEIAEAVEFVPLRICESNVVTQQGLTEFVIDRALVRDVAELGFSAPLNSVSRAMNQEGRIGTSLAMFCAAIGEERSR